MKNYQISPGQIPHLVRLTADLFREMREETKSPNCNPTNLRDESTQMHFVADLLKDLVDTAYPVKEQSHYIGIDKAIGEDYSYITLDLDSKSFEEALQKVNKIMKSYQPPKAGEF